MKKFVLFLFVAALLAGLASCGGTVGAGGTLEYSVTTTAATGALVTINYRDENGQLQTIAAQLVTSTTPWSYKISEAPSQTYTLVVALSTGGPVDISILVNGQVRAQKTITSGTDTILTIL